MERDGFFDRFRRRTNDYSYTADELDRRQENIPEIKVRRKSQIPNFDANPDNYDLKFEKPIRPIPASIEYLSTKYKRKTKELFQKKPKELDEDSNIFAGNKFISQQQDEIVVGDEVVGKKSEVLNISDLVSNTKEPVVEEISIPLASEEDINRLCFLHMKMYSVLSSIQETHVASEFRVAYNIQDRISYLINNKTILYASLVSELIGYLETIVDRLEKYHVDISRKQDKFRRYNKRISEIKNYKFKTDESIKIIEENKEIANSEIQRGMMIESSKQL